MKTSCVLQSNVDDFESSNRYDSFRDLNDEVKFSRTNSIETKKKKKKQNENGIQSFCGMHNFTDCKVQSRA